MPFSSFGLHPDLLRGVKEMGFTRPTPIQQDAIPPAMEGRDVLACAMTGSGKTAAFVLPILHRLMPKRRGVTRALIVTPTRELLRNPATINLERKAAPAVGITQAVYPVAQEVKSSLLLELIKRGEMKSALVFTRTKHRANRLADFLSRHNVACERIHGNRSQAQRTAALAGFKNGRFRILVATDIAARGIDVEALSHVINFDVPNVPDDYIHRVGRTARAELTGDAFTFVAPEEEGDLRAIERAIGKQLPRVTLTGFDYTKRSAERFEVPIGERIATIRARKAEERARARAKAERRAQQTPATPARTDAAPKPAPPGGTPRRRRRFGPKR